MLSGFPLGLKVGGGRFHFGHTHICCPHPYYASLLRITVDLVTYCYILHIIDSTNVMMSLLYKNVRGKVHPPPPLDETLAL